MCNLLEFTMNHVICDMSLVSHISDIFHYVSYTTHYIIYGMSHSVSYIIIWHVDVQPSLFMRKLATTWNNSLPKWCLNRTYVAIWNTVRCLAKSVHSIQSPRQGTAKHWSFDQEITMLPSCKPTMCWWDTYCMTLTYWIKLQNIVLAKCV